MKTIIATIGGTPTPGDLLVIEYSHPTRGGVSAVKTKVREPVDEIVTDPATGAKSVNTTADTIKAITERLAGEVNGMREWAADEFRAKLRTMDSFIVNCSDAVSDVVFKAYVEGAATETISIEEL
jgi:hypothetical protein